MDLYGKYLEKLGMECSIIGEFGFAKISPSDKRDTKSILNDLDRIHVMDFCYERWHRIFSSKKISAEFGSYCPVYDALFISLSPEEIQLLFDAHDPEKFNRNILGNLSKKIQKRISDNGPMKIEEEKAAGGFFVRISSRCLRDLELLHSKNPKKLRVKTGDMATTLLARSEDIHFDLANHFLFRDHEKFMNVVLIEWKNFKLSNQFWAFIFRSQLVAISQYFTDENFGYSTESIEQFQSEITDFIGKISKWIPYKNSIAHVYVEEGENQNFVKLVEFCPFESTSELGLYDWKADRNILCPNIPIEGLPHIRFNNTKK